MNFFFGKRENTPQSCAQSRKFAKFQRKSIKKLTQNAEKSREKAFFKIIETAQLPCEPLMILTDPKKKTAHTIQSILDFVFTVSKMIVFLRKIEKIREKHPFFELFYKKNNHF